MALRRVTRFFFRRRPTPRVGKTCTNCDLRPVFLGPIDRNVERAVTLILSRWPTFTIVSRIRSGGYIYCISDPPHPRRNARGHYAEHRIVVENAVGRPLETNEHVHHVDGNKTNNALANLEILSRREHSKRHAVVAQPVSVTCPECELEFEVKPHVLRQRLARSGGVVTCSRSCGSRAGSRRKPERHSYRGGCRCDECRAAHADQQRRHRSKIASPLDHAG
jgi:hypothetical protein